MLQSVHPLVRATVFLFLLVGLAVWLAGCGPAAPPPTAAPGGAAPPGPTKPVPAPIEAVSLDYGVGAPPQSFLVVVSGLPDGCTTFGEYTFSRQGDVFHVEVTNRRPDRADLVCTQIYGQVTSRIPLEADIEACRFYTAVVNGKEYRVQAIGPAVQCPAAPDASGTPGAGALDGAAELRLRVGESQAVGDGRLVITLLDVSEDSRCPREVVCVWRGQAVVAIGARQDGAQLGPFRVVLDEEGTQPGVKVGGVTVRLVALFPYPVSPGAIPQAAYLAVLVVSGG